MKFFVYLIIAKRKKSYISYVGYTKNLKKRIKLHNLSKGAKFTKGNFWSLIYAKSYDTKRVAMIEEYKLKKNTKLRSYLKKKYLKK